MTAPAAPAAVTPPGTPNSAPTTDQPTAPLSLADIRGPSYPLPGSATPGAVSDYVWQLWTAQDTDAFWRYRVSARYLLLAEGEQWIDWNTKDRRWLPQPRPEGRVQATINYVRSVLRSRLQRILSAELNWRSTPISNAAEARDQATIAQRFVAHRYDATQMDGKLRSALWLADCCGISFLKSFWNPAVGPLTPATRPLPHPVTGETRDYPVRADGTPLLDPASGDPASPPDGAFQYRPGDTDTGVRTVFNVRVNPEASGWTPDEGFRWLIDAELTPLSTIRERYGAIAKDLQTTDDLAQLRQYERLLRALAGRPGSPWGGTTIVGAPATATPLPDQQTTLLMEYWEEASEALPSGRLIVVAGRTLLYDGPLPQGVVPYVPIFSERRPFDPYGHPIVADMDSPQMTVNEQWSLIHEELRRDAVGQFIGFDYPGVFDQLSNFEDGHVRIPVKSAVLNRSINDIVQRMPHATINAGRLEVINLARAAIFDMGSFHEIQRGQVPPGVDSGVAVQLLQEAENAQLDDTVRTLKDSLIRWGRHQLTYGRWGYGPDESRWLPAPDKTKLYLVESVSGSDLPDPASIHLDLEGFKPTSEAARRAELTDLASRQILTGAQLISLLDLDRGLEGIFPSQTRHYDRARAENLAIQKGEVTFTPAPPGSPHAGMPSGVYPDGSPLLLPSEDDDDIHIAAHQDVALDNSQPWAIRQNVLLHIAEHRVNQEAKAAQMAAALAPPPPAPGETGAPGAPITAARANAPETRGVPQQHAVTG